MEQKTEASQAVDDLVRACKAATSDAEKVAAIDAYRAALKAQPAPTEAQARPDFSKFATIEEWQVAMSKWSLNAALVKAPTEAAQGEDSARLDAEVKRLRSVIDTALEGWNMSADLRKVLETALWPAVPQPQEEK